MDETRPDYDDPEIEEAWCEERRAEVVAFLAERRVPHGEVGEWPAWHVAPVVSIWAVESAERANAMGCWVICGDLPTDHVPARLAADPREAVQSIVGRWRAAADAAARGAVPIAPDFGRTAEELRKLAPMLSSRAELLARWAEDDSVWEELWDD
jgi:hypothetical protein